MDLEELGETDTDDFQDQIDSDSSLQAQKPAKPTKRRRRKTTIYVCLTNCKYAVLPEVCKSLGWRVVSEESNWDLYWSDRSVAPERLMRFNAFQRCNHFPGMYEISRKDNLSKNLNRMRRQYPEEFDFYPPSFTLPGDSIDFKSYYAKRKTKTVFISKPVAGCQGKGIFLFKSIDDIEVTEPQVVQRYINRPHLIGGLKYDLRIYLLVASVSPLRLFIYKKGMARFATQEYVEPTGRNLGETYMHLTNYSLNKKNDQFSYNTDMEHDDEGSKRSLESVWRVLRAEGVDVDEVWDKIKDIFVKTVVAIQPSLAHTHRTCLPNDKAGNACFEILGMDILLDSKYNPWLIEVNHSPSFNIDSPLDHELKFGVIHDSCVLLNMDPADKAKMRARQRADQNARLYRKSSAGKEQKERPALGTTTMEWEDEHMGDFERIFPCSAAKMAQYSSFSQDKALYGETTASKIRRTEIKRKMESVKEKAETERLAREGKPPRAAASADGHPRPKKKAPPKAASSSVKLSGQERFESLYSARPRAPKPVPRLAATGPNGGAFPSVFVAGESIEAHSERSRIADRLIRDRLITASGVREAIHKMLADPVPQMMANRPVVRAEPRHTFIQHQTVSGVYPQFTGSRDRPLGQNMYVGLGPVIRPLGPR
ncbi:Tubulin--tyrosine ligase [Carpediemonas membranifera]|uniref:Tubulin--tyrosine ligase n=1 Tax=Carpediemonas membranifera TaxID=201153 RepID=A0A8J6B807_9EUKA|nr:Tubulin--tyrosine ligase [Carpediemonas membranifera]|eukprot:KAG9394637.1 Tubulin--tyrosine ligase [Carpediemonas membranifera]